MVSTDKALEEPMIISVETPVFKGRWLRPAIDSVLQQTSSDWELSLLWDGGDEESKLILEELQRENHPQVHVHFGENRGIAHSRRFLTDHSRGDYILPLDDDDRLPPNTIERFLEYVRERPWCGIVRGQRNFIDEAGNHVPQNPWFPFERRHFFRGMVTDVFNHCQPYLIQRAAYERTAGWEGFDEFHSAGADCDMFLKIEAEASIELLDEVLYLYRINSERVSLALTDAAAFEMWRRLADKTIARLGLSLQRTNEHQPFVYKTLPQHQPDINMVDFWISPTQSEPQADRLRRQLLDLGIAENAIHLAAPEGAAGDVDWVDGTRSFVCLLTGDLELPSLAPVEALLSTLHQQPADMAGPKILSVTNSVRSAKPSFDFRRLPSIADENRQDAGQHNCVVKAPWLPTAMLLARREVLRATGDWNRCWHHPRLRSAELSLRARARDFRCMYIGTISVVDGGGGPVEAWSPLEADRFYSKWRDYADLFESLEIAGLAAILSPHIDDA